jgi:SAM-dependent methyltransferase
MRLEKERSDREMRGVRQIVRLNWPFYAAAATIVVVAELVIVRLPIGPGVRFVLHSATTLACTWMVASLLASWIVYDLSRLSRWGWIRETLAFRPRIWLNVHSGFDESTPIVRELLAPSYGRVFDIFDPIEMSEPSIVRARRLCPPAVRPELVDFHSLPAAGESIDAAFLLLSAHELRAEAARGSLFAELHRVLAPSGRVIVAEHLRDLANFAAFGPGFLHFFSHRTWTRTFARAHFVIDREFSITPFIRVFVLRRFV